VTNLDHAIVGLEQALEKPPRQQTWRLLVRQRLAAVVEALGGENTRAADAWLACRQSRLVRERETLSIKLDRLAGQVVDSADVEPLRVELKRIVGELGRYRQRLNDLLYDSVALELGGSE
jgi:hypothetical protein